MARFNFRSATKFLEKPVIRVINTPQLLLNRLTRQRIPMRVRRPFQIRQVSRHGVIVRIRQPVFVALTLPLMEVFMHLPHVVKQVAKTNTIRLVTKLIFIGFHGLSSTKSLTPNQWVGPTRNLAVTLVMSANLILLIIIQFRTKRQRKNEHFGPFQEGGVYIPKLKHGVLTPILINETPDLTPCEQLKIIRFRL